MTRTALPERLLSDAEVSEWLSVPTSTLRLWRREGHGPTSIKVGRVVRYRRADVERWLSAQASRGAES